MVESSLGAGQLEKKITTCNGQFLKSNTGHGPQSRDFSTNIHTFCCPKVVYLPGPLGGCGGTSCIIYL